MVGGTAAERGGPARWPVAAVVLNRGRFQRQQLIEQLSRQGFAEIVCLDSGAVNPDIEQQCRAWPRLRFMLLGGETSPGASLNLALAEARSPFVLVLWSDLSLLPFLDHALEDLLRAKALCVVPLLRHPDGSVVPSLAMPAPRRNSLHIVHALPSATHQASLFPFDYLGLYHRESFIQSQGYDEAIRNPFWQKLDFGYRAWLWGMRIEATADLRLQASLEPAAEDSTPDRDYARFYLKNLLPRFELDQAALPGGRFLAYRRIAGRGWLGAWREFVAAQAWVRANAFRFKHDARYVAELWESGKGLA